MLQEGEGELAEKRMVVQAAPASTLEMIEPQFVLHRLVHLLADPARLNQGRQPLKRHVGGEVGQVIFSLAARAMLADQPNLRTGQALPSCGAGPVGDANAPSREFGLERALRAGPPSDGTKRLRLSLNQRGGPGARGRSTGCLRGRPVAFSGRESVTSAG